MKGIEKRILSVFMTLALTFTMAVPALAKVYVEDVELDQNKVTMEVGETLYLEATISPDDATNQSVTWESDDTSVATVNKNGKVTAVDEGVTYITVETDDGGYTDRCKVTVEDDDDDDYVTGVTITSNGSGSLLVGSSRTLEATVSYKYGDDDDEVKWSTSNDSVATVSSRGVVKGVGEGKATITATSKVENRDGDYETDTYKITVVEDDDAESSSSTDTLVLSSQKMTIYGGQYLEKTLSAPTVTVKNGSTDVTKSYDVAYTWTDENGTVLNSGATLKVSLLSQGTQKYTCVVTALSKSDTSQKLTGLCNYTVSVLPGYEASGDVTTTDGTVKFLTIKDTQSGMTIADQLSVGIPGSANTTGISSLTYMVFDTATQTGEDKGTLSAQSGTSYYLYEGSSGSHLSDVTFTPKAEGTYTVEFLAYGDGSYYGQLEIRVTGNSATTTETDSGSSTPVVSTEGVLLTKSCDSSGYTFTGSDFFRYNDADPVVALDFGTPVRGNLIRNLSHGTGTKSTGEKYYTDSATDGQYHISTLTYLPKAGSSGIVSIPVTYCTRSKAETSGYIQINIQNKTDSDNFTDVTKDTVGTWAADSVDFAYGCGLMSGMGDGLFGPYENMTRGMLVTVLYRIAGSPAVTTSTSQFRDLDKTAYYYKAVNWASSKNIVNGVATGKFAPDNAVTREQIAVILYRFAEIMGGDAEATGSLSAFTDRSRVDSYATNAMTWAVSKGIITGTTTTTLSPLDYATRAQVTVMLHRYLTM